MKNFCEKKILQKTDSATKLSAEKIFFLYREARGMVRPFINTHQAETRTKARIKLYEGLRAAHTVRYKPGGFETSKLYRLTSFFKTG